MSGLFSRTSQTDGSAGASDPPTDRNAHDSGGLRAGATTCRCARAQASFVNSSGPVIHYDVRSTADKFVRLQVRKCRKAMTPQSAGQAPGVFSWLVVTMRRGAMANRVSVLVAEDETIIRLDLRAQLEESNYVVCGEAKDGHEAVALARTLHPDLAVLDVKMPGLDGIEAARMILAERPIPILMLTAYSDAELVRRAAKAGVYAYLVKPFRASDLLPAIETAIARFEEAQAIAEAVVAALS
jgi:AmiR/NasT family two-component response regulator